MNQNATLAALCIFNGLKLSPVVASPDPRFRLIGDPVHPRFKQCAAYLARFFGPDSTVSDFNPLEVFEGGLAVAPWVRGAVGLLGHLLHTVDGSDVPDAESIDPAAWFDHLHELVITYRLAVPAFGVTAPAKVQQAWEEPELAVRYADSRAAYLVRLYTQARKLQSGDEILVSGPAITKARHTKGLAPGENLPFPDQIISENA